MKVKHQCIKVRGSIHTQLATKNVNLTFLFHTHPPTLETSIRDNKKNKVNTGFFIMFPSI